MNEKAIEQKTTKFGTKFKIRDDELVMSEDFSEIHHKIISEIGTLLSSLGADSGAMAAVMSWGDTQDSAATLQMLEEYNALYSNK